LERDAVIRPALQADVVCAWCYRHGNILAFTLAAITLPAPWPRMKTVADGSGFRFGFLALE
jgi:hypothetical protein